MSLRAFLSLFLSSFSFLSGICYHFSIDFFTQTERKTEQNRVIKKQRGIWVPELERRFLYHSRMNYHLLHFSQVSLCLFFIFFNIYIHILAMMQKQNQIEMYLSRKLCFSKFVDVFKLKWKFAFRFHCFVFIMIGFHSIVCIYFKVLFVFLVMLFTW